MTRQPPSDEIDTLAYAISFFEAAKRLEDGEWSDNDPLVVPYYLLIGFSLENGLKAVLEHNVADKSTKWDHSHDLTKLRQLTEGHGLKLSFEVIEFVDHLSPLHRDHHFRYPKKAETAQLLKPVIANKLTEDLLKTAFVAIDGARRI